MEGGDVKNISDLYAEGKAARLWNLSTQTRSETYRSWLIGLLKENNCRTVLDAACGTGVDSVMLLEEGFQVVSTDFSDQMLKFALKERWNRRKEAAFDNWIIEEADWLTLPEDLADVPGLPDDGFDAVLCIGSSIAHLPDPDNDRSPQRRAINNLMSFVKPGGLLVIDHRNFDAIVATGTMPPSIFYTYKYGVDLKPSVSYFEDGKPRQLIVDYRLDLEKWSNARKLLNVKPIEKEFRFRMTFVPHLLNEFVHLLKDTLGSDVTHQLLGDFKPATQVETPAYYIHLLHKPL